MKDKKGSTKMNWAVIPIIICLGFATYGVSLLRSSYEQPAEMEDSAPTLFPEDQENTGNLFDKDQDGLIELASQQPPTKDRYLGYTHGTWSEWAFGEAMLVGPVYGPTPGRY